MEVSVDWRLRIETAETASPSRMLAGILADMTVTSIGSGVHCKGVAVQYQVRARLWRARSRAFVPRLAMV